MNDSGSENLFSRIKGGLADRLRRQDSRPYPQEIGIPSKIEYQKGIEYIRRFESDTFSIFARPRSDMNSGQIYRKIIQLQPVLKMSEDKQKKFI